MSYWEAGGGVLLGIDASAQVPDTMPLFPGSRLMLFTDGLVERRSEPIEVSLATLAGSVAAAHGLCGGTGPRRVRRSIDDVADGLLAAADGAADDVALVLVEATGPR
nr:SpoIIE family protein phosphatase [Frankia sp. QA3]